MLGEPYRPRGLALETARAVLECKNPMGCNTAMGCNAECLYCYGPDVFNKEDWRNVKYATRSSTKALWKLINKGAKPEGMFLSFTTDPWYGKSRTISKEMILLCHEHNIRTATLSKLSTPYLTPEHRSGVTVVSIDKRFWRQWEPRTLDPLLRLKELEIQSKLDIYSFISQEPFLPQEVFKQDVDSLWEEMKFADFIILGKMNYDKRSSTAKYKDYMYHIAFKFRDFCRTNGIRWHIKSETLKFVGLFKDGCFKDNGGYKKGLIQ